MGSLITMTARDGTEISVYEAPPVGKVRGALVILQEIFGLNSHIRSVCDRYAQAGWHVLSPALFDPARAGTELEYTARGVEQGRALKEQVDSRAEDDIADTLRLADPGLKIAVIGYCWGGSLAWRMACHASHQAERRIDAAVCYYGGELPVLSALSPSCPVMAHFGRQDATIPMENVEQFMTAQPEVISHLYDADHGFNCDQRSQFSAEDAALAYQRTIAFLEEHLC